MGAILNLICEGVAEVVKTFGKPDEPKVLTTSASKMA